MTEKELRKLRRQDFLQLLLMQGTELTEMETKLDETRRELELTKQSNERLKNRLNEKDELIEKLKGRLDAKDAAIHSLRTEMAERRASRRIELSEAGSIAMAALKLNGVFEAAQRAADQYLYNLQLLIDEYGPKPARQLEDGPAAEEEEDEAEIAADAELEQMLQVNREHDLADRAETERQAAILEALHEKGPEDEPSRAGGDQPEAEKSDEDGDRREEGEADAPTAGKKSWSFARGKNKRR